MAPCAFKILVLLALQRELVPPLSRDIYRSHNCIFKFRDLYKSGLGAVGFKCRKHKAHVTSRVAISVTRSSRTSSINAQLFIFRELNMNNRHISVNTENRVAALCWITYRSRENVVEYGRNCRYPVNFQWLLTSRHCA